MPEAVLVAAVRTPVGRAPKGALSTTRPDDLAATALNGALDKVPALDKSSIDDVILGCAQPEGEQGWNIARMAALRAGLPGRNPRRHRQPPLRLRPRGHRARRSAHPLRRARRSSSPAAPNP